MRRNDPILDKLRERALTEEDGSKFYAISFLIVGIILQGVCQTLDIETVAVAKVLAATFGAVALDHSKGFQQFFLSRQIQRITAVGLSTTTYRTLLTAVRAYLGLSFMPSVYNSTCSLVFNQIQSCGPLGSAQVVASILTEIDAAPLKSYEQAETLVNRIACALREIDYTHEEGDDRHRCKFDVFSPDQYDEINKTFQGFSELTTHYRA